MCVQVLASLLDLYPSLEELVIGEAPGPPVGVDVDFTGNNSANTSNNHSAGISGGGPNGVNGSLTTNATAAPAPIYNLNNSNLTNSTLLRVAVHSPAAGQWSALAAALRFDYYLQPEILSLSPRTGPIGGGTRIRVTGRTCNQE